jgi:hypothetical protein
MDQLKTICTKVHCLEALLNDVHAACICDQQRCLGLARLVAAIRSLNALGTLHGATGQFCGSNNTELHIVATLRFTGWALAEPVQKHITKALTCLKLQ